jgi:hypothetical protein
LQVRLIRRPFRLRRRGAAVTVGKPQLGQKAAIKELVMSRETLRPGERVNNSGIYRDPKSGERTTLVQGKTAPPTPERGGKWIEIDPTNPPRRGR